MIEIRDDDLTSAEWLIDEPWEYDQSFEPDDLNPDEDYVARYVRQGDFFKDSVRRYIFDETNLGIDHLNYFKCDYDAGMKMELTDNELALLLDSEAVRLIYNEDLKVEKLIADVEGLGREQRKFTDY